MKKIYFDDLEINDSILDLLSPNRANEIKKQEAVCFGVLTLNERELIGLAIFTQDILDEDTAVLEVLQAGDELWENNVLKNFLEYCEAKLKEAGVQCIYYRYVGRDYENVRCGRLLTDVLDYQYVNNKSAQLTVEYEDLISSVLMNDTCLKKTDISNIHVYKNTESNKAVKYFVSESRLEGFYMEIPPGNNNRSLLYQKDGVVVAAVKARVIAPNTLYIEQGHQLRGYTDRALVVTLLSSEIRLGIKEFGEDIKVIFEIENDTEYDALTGIFRNGKTEDVDEFIKAL